jgi:cell division protein ZipA
MIQGLSDTALLRIAIVVAALVLFLVIWLSARRKSGRKMAEPNDAPVRAERTEPTLRELIETGQAAASPAAATPQSARTTLEMDAMPAGTRAEGARAARRAPERRVRQDRLGVPGRPRRPDHRRPRPGGGGREGRPGLRPHEHLPPPGRQPSRARSDLQRRQPGQAGLFRPGGDQGTAHAGGELLHHAARPDLRPRRLDTLLPTAQRMAELLDAVLLDEERNALGRQRIANIRDEMRAYDRAREKQQIRPGR